MGNLHLKKITKSFSGNILPTLKDISLNFKEGELYSILGENGSGKSTLLGIISGTIFPTDGKIEINKNTITKINSKKVFSKNVGIIQQKPILCAEATILEHTFIVNETLKKEEKLSDNELKNKIFNILETWNFKNLKNYLSTKVKDLSDSQQFYTSLLCTLIKEPDFLLLDEPASLLNSKELLELEKNLKEFCKKNKTVIVVTHSISQAERLSDNLFILKKSSEPIILHGKFSRDEILQELITENTNENYSEVSNLNKKEKTITNFNFSIQNLSTNKLNKINLKLKNKNLIIIHGLPQDGIEDLEDCLCGFKKPLCGKSILNDKEIKWNNPKELLLNNIHFIPSDCINRGSSAKTFIYETLMTNEIRNTKLWLLPKIIKQKTEQMILEEGFPHPPVWKQLTSTLSGGMRQRLVIRRELKSNPIILFLAQPDKGLDRKSLKSFQEKILNLCNNGLGVIILTRNKELYKFDKTKNILFYELKEGKLLC